MSQTGFEIPSQRLSRLSPKNLAEYRDLAEELSPVRSSARARDLTVRLYLICASLSDGPLRRSALRGLVHSARTESERRKFMVLCFLTDPEFSSLLVESSQPAVPPPRTKKEDPAVETPREKLLDALVSIRQGKPLRARKIMEAAEVQEIFKQFSKDLSLEAFNEACLLGELPNEVLFRILKIDYRLRNESRSELPAAKQDNTELWRFLFREKLPDRIPEITFDSVTEFDPSHSVYQNGVWQKSPK